MFVSKRVNNSVPWSKHPRWRPSRQQYQLHGRGIPDMGSTMFYQHSTLRGGGLTAVSTLLCNMTGWRDTCALSIVDKLKKLQGRRPYSAHTHRDPNRHTWLRACPPLQWTIRAMMIVWGKIIRTVSCAVLCTTIIVLNYMQRTLMQAVLTGELLCVKWDGWTLITRWPDITSSP